jgi:hypothetical protein
LINFIRKLGMEKMLISNPIEEITTIVKFIVKDEGTFTAIFCFLF